MCTFTCLEGLGVVVVRGFSLSLPLRFSEAEKLFESLVCEEARSVKFVPRLGLVVISMFGLLGVNGRLFGRVLLAVRKVVACC